MSRKKKTPYKKQAKNPDNKLLMILTLGVIVILIIIIIINSLSGKKYNDVKIKENNSLMYSKRMVERLNTNNENVLISDLSLNPTLSIFYEYGNEKVKQELQNYFEKPSEEIMSNYDKIYTRYKDAYKKVNFENSFWINKNNYPISKEVINTAKNKLHFIIKEKDFSRNQTATEMNQWVKKKSHNRVTSDFKANQIKEMSSILMGTLYFNEKWKSTYEENNIKDGTFYGINGEKEVTYLYSEENTYLESDKAIGFMKPYEEDGLFFIGIIPTEGNNLENINLNEVMNNKKNASVDVKIPEFSFKYDVYLTDTLKEMGIKSIFESGNLDKIAKSLYVSKILQKNYIKVDRNGTEAFSLNASTMETTSLEPENPRVYLDKPFLFLIYDDKIDQVLFIGRVNEI